MATRRLARRRGRRSEVLLVEDELDVALGVRQTLLLQRLPQLGGAAQKHPHFGPEDTEVKAAVRGEESRLLRHSKGTLGKEENEMLKVISVLSRPSV